MFSNYVLIALRNISKNKLYAVINIVGLAMGLAIYIFANVLADYERTHDTNWANVNNIYTIGITFNPKANVGIKEADGTQSALGPILEAELSDIELVARTIGREFLVSVGADNFYESTRFADPEFLTIFDFDYVYGDSSALDNTTNVLLTQTMATKLFGDENPIGKTLSLDHENDLTVSAVIKDVPLNTHFASGIIMSAPMGIIIPMDAMKRITEFDPDSDWGNISIGNMTYVLLPDHLDGAWLKDQVDGIQKRMVPEERAEIMIDFTVNRLQDANLFLWRAFNLPVMTILKFLGLMVLIVACINYTNLATAQSMSRTREVGLRKTMGASRKQLLFQFMIESLTIASLATAAALAIVEISIPAFNSATGKAMAIGYLDILPWVLFSTLMVGLLAGAYPAMLITKTHPIDALRDSNRKGAKGTRFRSLMIGTQFFVSVMLLAMVSVLFMQNQKVEEASNIYPKESVYTISRIGVKSIEDRHETLRNEMVNLPGVMNVSFSSQVPFEQNNSSFTATPEQANEAKSFSVNILRADHDFLETYNIPILAGRSLNREIARDTYIKEVNIVNVLVNEMAASNLGFTSNEDALGSEFYDVEEGEETTVYSIVGVLPDQNILGFHNTIKPWVFFAWPDQYRVMSIRLTGDNISDTVKEIENVWDRIVPDYPMQGAHLNEKFREIFKVFRGANAALAGFAMLALLLALIGLFGLAAFMAEQRTKEIGIRKVMGASSLQIVKLLVLKFSKPVIIAAPLALILAFLGAQQYLNFFADRIDDPYWIVLASGVVAIFIAWVTVAAHAIKVARANPINALHYE